MAKPSVLLDTMYLLPVFGVDVGLDEYGSLFPRILEELHVYYSPLSLVEAKWVILKLSRMKPDASSRLLDEYRRGLEAILADNRLKETIITNSMIEEVADHLLEQGLHDYFDRMIYATAYYYNAILLSEDRELKSINEKTVKYKLPRVISWADIRSMLGKRR